MFCISYFDYLFNEHLTKARHALKALNNTSKPVRPRTCINYLTYKNFSKQRHPCILSRCEASYRRTKPVRPRTCITFWTFTDISNKYLYILIVTKQVNLSSVLKFVLTPKLTRSLSLNVPFFKCTLLTSSFFMLANTNFSLYFSIFKI